MIWVNEHLPETVHRYFHHMCHKELLIAAVSRCSLKKVVLNIFKFTGQHFCWGVILIKLKAYSLQLRLKERETWPQVFSWKFSRNFQKRFFAENLWASASELLTSRLKINDRNTKTRCAVCSKLTIKTPEWRPWHNSGVFIVNFERIADLVLVLLLLTLNT